MLFTLRRSVVDKGKSELLLVEDSDVFDTVRRVEGESVFKDKDGLTIAVKVDDGK